MKLMKLSLILLIMMIGATGVYADTQDEDNRVRQGQMNVQTPFIADLNATSMITVYVETADGQPWANADVVVVSNRNTGNQIDFIQPDQVTTNSEGLAYFTVSSDIAGSATLFATNLENDGFVDDATIEFRELSADNSFLVVNPNSAEANGDDFVTVTTYFRDENDQPIPFVPYEPFDVLANPSNGVQVDINEEPSDQIGRIQATVSSTVVGVKSIVATWYDYVLGSGTATFTPGPIDPSASEVSVNPTAAVADSVSPISITIALRDAQGNPRPNFPASQISVDILFVSGPVGGGGNNVVMQGTQTNANGIIVARLTSYKVGYKQVVITVDEPNRELVVLDQRPQVRFDSGLPSMAHSQVNATPTQVTADGEDHSTITIQILDRFNNPPFPNPINTDGAVMISMTGSNNYYVQPTGPTSEMGITTGQVRSITAELKTVTATVFTELIEEDVDVQFVAGPAEVMTTLVEATSPIVANGMDTSFVTITVRDTFGNAVPDFPDPGQNESIQFWVTPEEGITITQPLVGTTNTQGQIMGSFISTMAGNKVVRAQIGLDGATETVVDTAVVVVNPDVANSGTSIVSGSPEIVVADNEDECLIYIQLNDSQGNPIPDIPSDSLEVEISGSNNFMLPLGGETNEDGEITTTFTSTKAEEKVITVYVHQGLDEPVVLISDPVEFIPGPLDAGHSSVVAAPEVVVADGVDSSVVTITARDFYNNPIPGIPQGRITVNVSGVGDVDGPNSGTNPEGISRAFVTSTESGSTTVTVTIQEVGSDPVQLDDQPQITFIAGLVDTTMSSITATTPHQVGPDDSTTITLTLKDMFGNPLVGFEPGNVRFISDSEEIPTFSPTSVTDENGQTQAYVKHTVAEVVTFIARVQMGSEFFFVRDSLGIPASVTFLPGPPSGQNCNLEPPQQTKVVGDTTTVSLYVHDQFGNPIPGIPPGQITFYVSGTNNNPSSNPPALTPTDADGMTRIRFWSTRAEQKVVSATVQGIEVMDESVVNYMPAAVHADNSIVSAAPLEVIADGLSRSTISITLRDRYFNPIPNVNENAFAINIIGPNNGDCTNCQLMGFEDNQTNSQGEIQNALVSWEPEPLRISVIAREIALADSPLVVFVENSVSGDNTTITASPETVVADSLDQTTITVTVRNANEHPIPGIQAQAIQLFVSGEANFLSELEGATDLNGQISATLASTKAEVKEITAVVSGIPVDDNANVTFIPGEVNNEASWMTATTPVIADGVSHSLVTIQFMDKYENPIPRFGSATDTTFFLEAVPPDTAGVVIFQPQLPANNFGQTFARVTSTIQHVGDNAVELRAFLNEQPLAQPALVEFFYKVDLTNSTVTVQPSQVYANGSDSAVVQVTLRNINDYPITGIPITVFSSRNTGEEPIDLIEQPGATNDEGVARGYIRSDAEGFTFVDVVAADTLELATNIPLDFIRAPLALYDSDSLYAEPNPFTPDDPNGDGRTRINIPLKEHTGGTVTIRIFDVSGSLVKELPAEFDGRQGVYYQYWDGTDANNDPAPSGIYIYQVDASGTEVLNSIVGLAR